MKAPDIKAIKNQLPHGAISEIAENIGVDVRIVSQFFTKGWHQQYSNAILENAVNIIKRSYPAEELMDEIDDLGLTGYGSGKPTPKRRNKSVQPSSGSGSGSLIILGVLGFIIAWFLIPGFKDKLKSFFNKPENIG